MEIILANIALGIVGGYIMGLLVTLACGRPYRWRQDRPYHIAMAALFAVMGAVDATLRVVF